ncbi:hypothetical protein EJ02DRAFT_506836 [Clathrospora elynae]|uniref:Uncharacterized protein n=1 Tax=Clathrospora elynae TaxID=706981 RepID=A0A6A5SEM1_9PLEO|nr:hypothetical protein EJ02DRAFT_506836 [Clathrospora elynae]
MQRANKAASTALTLEILETEELIQYIRQSQATRQLSYQALAIGPFQHWEVTQYSIRHALRSRGYTQQIALAKPPLTEQNRQIRLYNKTWVTGKDTCIVDKIRKKHGWMFWACFSGTSKGPCLFWEKDWLRMNPHLRFMQDRAPGHSAAYKIEELHSRVWNKMKDYIELNHPDLPAGKQRTYDQLRVIVQEA